MKKLFYLMIVALLQLTSHINNYAQIKIMPMGESVAWGASSSDWGGYRRPLHILLSNYGYNFDFVGGQSLGILDDFDADNECHRSWFADHDPDTAQNRNLVNWVYQFLNDHSAHIILLYIGTTDLIFGDSAGTVVTEVESILNEIDRYEKDHNKNIKVLLSTLINCNGILSSSPVSKEISTFNQKLIEMANKRINDPSIPDNLLIVDMENKAGLNYRIDPDFPFKNGDMRDGFYPNDSGYVKMAKVWADALHNVLGHGDPDLIDLHSPADGSKINSTNYTFKWGALPLAENYRIQVANDFYFRNNIFDQKNVTGDSLLIRGLEPDQQYYWRIIAKMPDDKITYSTIKKFSVQTTIPTDSLASLHLLASELPLNKIKLTWDDITDNELGFIIERKIGKGNFAVIDTVPENTTSFIDSSLTTHLIYYYRIKSFDRISASVYSNVTKTLIISILPAPLNLNSTLLPSGKVKLSWIEISGNELGFIIERKEGLSSFAILDTISQNTISYIDSNLTDGATYTYRIKSYKKDNFSAYSNETVIKINTILSAPTDLTVTILSYNKVKLSWSADKANELGFIIERKAGNANFLTLDTVDINTSSFIDSNLAPNTTYLYRIKSFNRISASAYSNQAVALLSYVLSAPANLKITRISTKELELSWSTVNDDNIIGFIIERKTGKDNFKILDTIPLNKTTYKDSNIKIGISYNYRIKSFNSYLSSRYSNEASIVVTSASDQELLPDKYMLGQNYPNPFNPVTNIPFQLPIASYVEIKVYNTIGKEITSLIKNHLNAGTYNIKFDASNLPSGIYFYRILAGNFSDIKKLILIK